MEQISQVVKQILFRGLLAAFLLALLISAATGGRAFAATSHNVVSQNVQSQTTPHCSPCYTWYGAIHSWMVTATSDWFEHQNNWCGIANVRAIQVYDWIYWGNNGGSGTTPQWDNSQEAIHNRLNTTSSPWGAGGGYVTSDISQDFGTDPHSLAFGAWYETPVSTSSQPYYFHNWIYRTSALTATEDFATDFGSNTVSHNDPISVTINGGFHSFVVDGVMASGDPSLGSVAIQSIDTWDPWLNSANAARDGVRRYNTFQNQEWSLSDWTSMSKFWGQPYNTGNGSDPEPDTPNHYYVPPIGPYNHWNGYYVTIEQDRIQEDIITQDYAIDQDGFLAPHN